MRVLWEWIVQALGNEDLPRRIREMLGGADDMRDPHVIVIDHTSQVIQYRAVGPLDDVVLLLGPRHLDPAADVVVEDTPALPWHFQAYHTLTALGLEAGSIPGGLGHPAAAIAVGALRLVCGLPLCSQFVCS